MKVRAVFKVTVEYDLPDSEEERKERYGGVSSIEECLSVDRENMVNGEYPLAEVMDYGNASVELTEIGIVEEVPGEPEEVPSEQKS